MLCIIMVLSLCACNEAENTAQTESTTQPTEAEVLSPASEFDFGSVYGKSYSNTTMGIGISLPSEFVITSTEELAKISSIDEELMTTNLPKAMENTLRAYIFAATDNAGSYMNIIVENLRISNKAFIFGHEYFNIYSEEIKQEIEDMGGEDVTITPSKVTIAGTEHDVALINYTLSGDTCSETRIAFPSGNFIAIMTLKGDTSLILNRIYGL